MQVVVICNESQKNELMSNGISGKMDLAWVQSTDQLASFNNADAVLDLLFQNEPGKVSLLSAFNSNTIVINSVEDCLKDVHPSFTRINAWPGFLNSGVIEASSLSEEGKESAVTLFSHFNKSMEWLPDEPGFITARVISMVINEAYLALEEGVSTQADINTAMKLGTNYPYGPFEWAEKIGVQRVCSLLKKLSLKNPAYFPSSLLIQAGTAS